ncbi:MAG: alpha/beta hydrolase [Cyanobacteria bacterium REEB67]|nr:alpha/beta hydrolase [Cyanobacteria bacterium REEB67]
MLRIIAYINLINALLLFMAALLIFLPAPFYFLWLVAALVSELPVQIALCGLILLLVSQAIFFSRRFRLVSMTSACLTSRAIAIALPGIGSIYQYAKTHDQALSWTDTFNFNGPAATLWRKLDSREYARRSDFASVDHWLASLGYAVFDLDYRLCRDTVHFPAPEEDVALALAWIKLHADEYHIDPERIALLGRSAGAQLALVSAYKPTEAANSKTPVRCVISYYGLTDLAWDHANPIEPHVIDACAVLCDYMGATPYESPSLYAQASACALVSRSTPPTLFPHGDRDQLVSPRNVDRLAPILTRNKIPYAYCLLPWANHGFDWHFNGLSSQLSRVVLKKFLYEHIRN